MVDKASAPAFSMGHSNPQKKLPNDFVPGPGAYESNYTSLTQSKLGSNIKRSEVRFKQRADDAPGPGTYNYEPAKGQGPKALVLSRSKEKVVEKAPGPGAYNPNYKKVVKQSGGWTTGHAPKLSDLVGEAKNLPGPCNYQTNKSTLTHDNAIKIGNQRRSQMVLNKFSPGPGQYNQVDVDHFSLKKSSVAVFGKAGRSLSTNQLLPGPGTYSSGSMFTQGLTKGKGFSLSSRHPQNKPMQKLVPGPGQYHAQQLQKLKYKSSSYSIGKSDKLKLQGQKQFMSKPGPTSYNIKITYNNSKNYVFGKDKRQALANNNKVPGPGSYNNTLTANLPQFSIPKSATNVFKLSENPGPGTYESKISEKQRGQTITMAKDNRRAFYNEKKDIPGPGSYEAPVDKSKGGYSLGKEKRSNNKEEQRPGPANYAIPSTLSNVPRYSHN